MLRGRGSGRGDPGLQATGAPDHGARNSGSCSQGADRPSKRRVSDRGAGRLLPRTLIRRSLARFFLTHCPGIASYATEPTAVVLQRANSRSGPWEHEPELQTPSTKLRRWHDSGKVDATCLMRSSASPPAFRPQRDLAAPLWGHAAPAEARQQRGSPTRRPSGARLLRWRPLRCVRRPATFFS
jgi:hypothetical protein